MYDTKSPAEREQHRTSLLPGPGTYNPQDCPGRVRVRGGQFQPRKPPIEELWALKRAAGVPDPGTYTLKSTVEKVAGGRFNPGTKPLTGDDWALKRASQTPGPGEYKLKTSVDLIIAQPTGRFISGVPKVTTTVAKEVEVLKFVSSLKQKVSEKRNGRAVSNSISK